MMILGKDYGHLGVVLWDIWGIWFMEYKREVVELGEKEMIERNSSLEIIISSEEVKEIKIGKRNKRKVDRRK